MKKLLIVGAVFVAALTTGCASDPYRNQYQSSYGRQSMQRAYGEPDYGAAAAGATIGGLAGSRAGRGNGRLATVGIGAATGAVIGSGCRFTPMSGVGGLAGGLIGSMIGKGRGRKLAIAIGAGAGATAGADCR